MTSKGGIRQNDDVTDSPSSSNITLGILAGGRATRLGGLDKAWLQRDGESQVQRGQRRFAHEIAAVLVSANRDLARYAQAGLSAVTDRLREDLGPIAGLDTLVHACRTTWLLTIPVDLIEVNERLLPMLVAGSTANGAYAHDDDGPQPLVALWRVAVLRDAVAVAIATGNIAVHALQTNLDMACVRFSGVRFGNLNTLDDLAAAGVSPSP